MSKFKKMRKFFLLIFLMLIGVKGFSQKPPTFKIPQPEIVEGKDAYNKFMQKARDSFKVNNFAMCYSWLKEAESEGHATAEFYFYIGVSTYFHKKNIDAARRYLMNGVDKFSSDECKDALFKINEDNKKLKSSGGELIDE